jgi:hypothetical protein
MSDPEQVIQNHIDAWNNHDGDSDPWSEDATFRTPDGTVLKGRQEIIDFENVFWTAFPDAKMTIVARVANGNIVMSEGRMTGTHDGPLQTPDGEVPPTGRKLDLPWMCIQEVDGDVCIRENAYFNQMDFLAQLGLLEAATA